MIDWRVITGDCLEVMQGLEAGSVDAVITDPPYLTAVSSDGSGKINPWADRLNYAFWFAAWMTAARLALKPEGCLWSFMNWRSYTTYQKAADDMRWGIESVLVWDKAWIGPGGTRGLRPSYELVGLWGMPRFALPNRGLYDIQRFPWSSTKPTGHPAEKPVTLVAWLIEQSTRPGDLILDPFCGSGTTGVACVQTDRRFIGIELDAGYADMARARIAKAAEQARQMELAIE